MRRFLPLLVALASLPTVARAHDDVDEGVRLTGLAQFDQALAAFARAEAGDDLTRDDLVVLYESRAVLLAAMGRPEAMERDLAHLAALDPSHALPAAAPPEVAERFRALSAEAQPLEVLAAVRWDVGAVTVRAVSSGDPGDLVRRVRVGARLVGREYALGDDRVQLVTADASNVEYYAEAIGPGGAIVAASGSPEAPLTSAAPAAGETGGGEETGPSPVPTDPQDQDDDGGIGAVGWLLVGGGVALVIAAAILIGMLASSGQPETSLSGPMAMRP